ncbi:MAG: hypothetical protein IIC58_14255 [Proteobacteria bacterium]|nr:hypothetical protein [Pseudomonadota bacterium]
MTDKININDVGTDLQVTIKEAGIVVDVSGAKAIQIELPKSGGAKVLKTATFSTTGVDGVIH